MKYLQVGFPDAVRGLNLFGPVIPPESRGIAQCMDLDKLFLKLYLQDLMLEWAASTVRRHTLVQRS